MSWLGPGATDQMETRPREKGSGDLTEMQLSFFRGTKRKEKREKELVDQNCCCWYRVVPKACQGFKKGQKTSQRNMCTDSHNFCTQEKRSLSVSGRATVASGVDQPAALVGALARLMMHSTEQVACELRRRFSFLPLMDQKKKKSS